MLEDVEPCLESNYIHFQGQGQSTNVVKDA